MQDTAQFGRWLKERRKALDLTQEQLARQIGCALITIKKLEADERRPSRQIAERLLDVLAIPPAEQAAFLCLARARRSENGKTSIPVTPGLAAGSSEAEDLCGRVIKGYEVRERIGMGGFGVVYRAFQAVVGRDVAIKNILPHFVHHPDFIRRFEAEAQLVARLEHPHIVPLYDYWRDTQGAYLVMRWMRGGNLRDALRAGPWSGERAARLLEQLAPALALAHRQGVVHRNIKPTNILLDEGDNTYLADLGIARDLITARASEQTPTELVLDAMRYLAPEQIRDEPITPRTDVYALGMVLYELLAGATPFPHGPAPTLLYKHLYEPVPPLLSKRPELPAGLDSVIQRATAKDVAVRYSDPLSFAEDFWQALSGATTHAVVSIPAPALKNPYKGLRPFDEADAADFYGRVTLTEQLLARLGEETDLARFLAVVGPSGSGKSSVVRAGVIPALRRGALPGSENWFIADVLPSAHPVEEIEAALLRLAINPPTSLLQQLMEDECGLLRTAQRILPDDGETELVLVIDQFEEVWTLMDDEATRVHLLQSILTAVRSPRSRLRVIVTLRADFYDRPLAYGGFGELIRTRTEVVLPLTLEELRLATIEPAKRVELTFQPELIAAILHDSGQQPGTLPLLQYALTDLVERRQGRTLTLQAYHASGGLSGALARRADEIYARLDHVGQALARQIFLRLVTLGDGGEDTRRRVRRRELETLAADPHAVSTVVDAFGRYRLLTFDRDPVTRGPTVEIAHEALIRAWPRLRAWLIQDREGLRLHRQLTGAAQEWEALARDPGALYRGARLAQTTEWTMARPHDLNPLEWEFLAASQEQARQEEADRDAQRQRELAAAQQLARAERRRAEEQGRVARQLRARALYLAGALMLAVAAAVAAAGFARSAEANFVASERVRLAAQAQNALDRNETGDLPALLALRSLQDGYTPQADAALLKALARGLTRQHFVGHTDATTGVTVSPDGHDVLTASMDKTARLWDAQSGEELRQFRGHTAGLWSAVFSPDGQYILTSSQDTTARLWDARSGKELRQFRGHTAEVWDVAFSPDGNQIVTSAADKTARLWDVATGRELRQFAGDRRAGHVGGVAFAPDGASVLAGNEDGVARLWNVRTGQEVRQFRGHTNMVSEVAFSPDGKRLLTGSMDDTARLWDMATGRELLQLRGHTARVWGVAYSPDGQYVLTASWDKTARLWDARTGRELRVFSGHTDWVHDVAFSPDGQYLLTSSEDRTATLRDTVSEIDPRSFVGHTDEVIGVDVSPDGLYLFTASVDRTARLWEIATGRELRAFTGHTDWVNAVGVSPDGRYVLTSSDDRTARLWDAGSAMELRTFKGHTDLVRGAAFSPDGRYVLTASWDKTARLWDARTGRELRVFSGHTDRVLDLAISTDGTYLLTAGADKTARLWNVQTGAELRQFGGHADEVLHVSFSHDGAHILTGSADGTAGLWETMTGKRVQTFAGHTDWVNGVAFSPDGRYVLTGSYDQTARVWDVETGRELRRLTGHTDRVWKVAWAPDGQSVVTVGGDGLARLWQVDYHHAMRLACAQLTRDFTAEERKLYDIDGKAPLCVAP